MNRTETPFVRKDKDRHGNLRYYVRRNGHNIRVYAEPGTEDWFKLYALALDGSKAPKPKAEKTPAGDNRPPKRQSFGWFAKAYFASLEFKALDPQSQKNRRQVIESCLAEKHKGKALRDCPMHQVTPAKLKRLRDTKAALGKKGAANNRLKYLSSMFAWGIEAEVVKSNPCRDVRRMKYASEGFHTWTIEEVHQFEAKHAIGTKPRLALALLLFLGNRSGDIVGFGRQHLRNTDEGQAIRYVPRKTRYRTLETLQKPILPVLADVLAQSPSGGLTFIQTEYGRPFTRKGFYNWFKSRCVLAGLPHCTPHGLRKAGATIAADNGATIHQLMAIYDWHTTKQAETYTRRADRKRLAASSMHLLNAG